MVKVQGGGSCLKLPPSNFNLPVWSLPTPKPPPRQRKNLHYKTILTKMINLIGSQINEYRGKKLNENEFFYDYLKKEIKEKRKMGHLTILNKKD